MAKGGNGGGKPGGSTTFTIGGLTDLTDSGASSADDLTNHDDDFVLEGTFDPALGTDPAAINFTVTIDGVAYTDGITLNPDGTWTFDFSATGATLPSGSFDAVASYQTTHPKTGKVQTKATAPYSFEIDAVALAPAGSGAVQGDDVVLSGSAEAFSTVLIYRDGLLAGETTADALGNWSFTHAGAGAGGSYTATSTDLAGNLSATTALTVTGGGGGTPPGAPVITGIDADTGIAGDGITSDSSPILNGTAAGAVSVDVYIDGVLSGSAAVAGDAWSYNLSVLGDGTYQITAVAIDGDGLASAASAAFAVEVDTSDPAAAGALALSAGGEAVGALTNQSDLTLSGTAEDGATVLIYLDGALTPVQTTATGGTWSYAFGGLGEGAHDFDVHVADVAGNLSPLASTSVTIDTTAPAAPVISGFTDDTGAADGITADATPTLSGTAAANATVRVFDGLVEIGTTAANALGAWSLTLPALADGDHDLTATATDGAGNQSAASGVLAIHVDTVIDAATLTGLAADDGTPDADGVTGDTTPSFRGTAEVGATVTLHLGDGTLIGTETDTDGTWLIQSSLALAHGVHTVYATVTDAAGNTLDTATFDVTVDAEVDLVTIGGLAAASDSGTLGDDLTNVAAPVLTGQTEAGATVALHAVIGGVVSGPALATVVADGSGNWSASPGTLAEGSHSFRALATDAYGNTLWSGDYTLTVDLSVLEATAAGTGVWVDGAGGSNSELLPPGQVTADRSPDLRGTGVEAFATVAVLVGGVLYDSVQADATGAWQLTLSGLADGTHVITFETTDLAGNTEASADQLSITVDGPETGPTSEPLYGEQWNLAALGDIEAVWADYSGAGVHVGVYDDGIEYSHSDLDDNYRTDGHLNWNGTLLDPAPVLDSEGSHGTAAAGLIAAEANGEGTVGIAWGADLSGVNIFTGPANVNEGIDEYNAGDANGRSEGFEWAIQQMYLWDVVSHSWGMAPIYLNDRPLDGSWPFYQAYPFNYTTAAFLDGAAYAAEFGRGGLGTLMVKAAGNWSDSAQGDYLDTSRYTITAAAYDSDGDASYYSNRGANILVSAPASGFTESDSNGDLLPGSDLRIATTDRQGGVGYSPDDWSSSYDTTGFGGTSAATPQVAGVIALMLEANPLLGWRDVQDILAQSAKETGGTTGVQNTLSEVVWVDADNDFTRESLVDTLVEYFPGYYNGAGNWNGGGHHFSEDYGFGKVDVLGAVRMAEVWSLFGDARVSTNELREFTRFETSRGIFDPISGRGNHPDAVIDDTGLGIRFGGTSLPDTFTYQIDYTGAAMQLEYVELFVDINLMSLADLALTLESPDGTVATFLSEPINDYAFEGTQRVFFRWDFGANSFRGEDPAGTWTVSLTEWNVGNTIDGVLVDVARLEGVGLTFYGSAYAGDDTYHYTDEIVTLGLHADAGRRVLSDLGGTDWIDMAAVTYDLQLNLQDGASSHADAWAAPIEILQLSPGTVIENAVTGDGDDQLVGNDGANRLAGMRGNDTIEGGAGTDEIYGHRGDDELWGGADADIFFFEAGHGDDWIGDFLAGVDLVALSGFLPGDLGFSDLGADRVLDLAGGDSITFAGLAGQDLSASIDLNGGLFV